MFVVGYEWTVEIAGFGYYDHGTNAEDHLFPIPTYPPPPPKKKRRKKKEPLLD